MAPAECNISFSINPQLASYDRLESWRIIDCVLSYIQSTGLPYFTGPSETTIEGPLDELLAVVAKAQRICIEQGAIHAVSHIKIYYDPKGKLAFNERLQRTLEHRG
ncbi:MAG: thiamine-binding protein [Spirochaetota bacterium]